MEKAKKTKKLVIVESPNKIATLKKYLGKDFEVVASAGHIAKMSTSGKNGLGIDLENWEPLYTIDPTRKKIIKEIKEQIKKNPDVLIATDPDREGEAIGDHLIRFLKIKNSKRIKFNEITQDAVLKAIEAPTEMDENLIKAQKTRRMLDRIIGFRLSQLMKKKLTNTPNSPSAGRVQSIALKLVIDKEKEIEAFVPEDFHRLNATLESKLIVKYINPSNEADKKDWIFPNELEKIKQEVEKPIMLEMQVVDIKQNDRRSPILTPFKQAILYKRSPYSSVSTQSAAQKLYESGLISYPRTDSTRLSEYFLNNARTYIKEKWGEEYILQEIKGFAGDQDAHEAIRPTDIKLTPNEAKTKYNLDTHEYGVYKLIYEHTLQCLINPPIRTNKTYSFKKHSLNFKAVISSIKFNGYYVVKFDEPEEQQDPNYQINDIVKVLEYNYENCATKPPARYSEGSLIEALDEIKVGRPSTFATTVKTILHREYVNNKNGSLIPTEFGKIVMQKLLDGFPDIINEEYTAKVEEELDLIAKGLIDVPVTMQDFYEKFEKSIDYATQTIEHTKMLDLELEELCPNCNSPLIIKKYRSSEFIGCSSYPNCKYSRNTEKNINKRFTYFNKPQNNDDDEEDL